MRALVAAIALALAFAACATTSGGVGGYDGAGEADKVAAALARSQAPSPGPRNATGKPLAFLVGETSTGGVLVAVDLSSNRVLWQTAAEVEARVEVGHKVVVFGEKNHDLVALDVTTGRPAWRSAAPKGSKLLGHGTDGQGVYAVYVGAHNANVLVGLDEQGGVRFRVPLDERVGAPAARGGVVAVPQLSQFVSLFDARTGGHLADILARDESAAFVKGLPEGFVFGSQGVFVASAKTATATYKGGGYLQARLPEFVRPAYHVDMYKPGQLRHSALDRNRLLWRVQGPAEKPSFRNGQVVIHNFRFFFSMRAADGSLAWAYSHPRLDAIASSHTGKSIVFADAQGELGALDASHGGLLLRGLPQGLPELKVVGASFDAEGFAASGPGAHPAPPLADTLKSIALDPDKRFNDVRVFAVEQLSQVDSPGVTAALLEVLQKGTGEPYVLEKAAERLVQRQDKNALPVFIEAIKVKPDYAEGRDPQRLDLMARALAKLGAKDAMGPLVDHVRLPETDPGTVAEIAEAAIALNAREVLPTFRDYLAMYRADPSFMSQPGALIAAANVLVKLGDAFDRTLLLYVSQEPKTLSSLKVAVDRLLSESSGGPALAPTAD